MCDSEWCSVLPVYYVEAPRRIISPFILHGSSSRKFTGNLQEFKGFCLNPTNLPQMMPM